jgi:hypothetical protein
MFEFTIVRRSGNYRETEKGPRSIQLSREDRWRPVEEKASIPAAALLDSWSEAPWTNGVQVDRMEDMEKLVVRTGNSLYEIIIIDGASGEILVRGGQFFPELTPARLTGATLGGSFCKLRGIYAGFRMELYANGQRTVTTPVESVGVLAST